MGELFEELKRRNVIRVAVAYAVAAWVLLQIVDLVLDAINAPDWVIQAFILALAIGFPLVLLFAWAFELTPDGLKREQDVDRARSVTHETAKKLDQVTIVLLVLVVAFVFVERSFFATNGAPTAADESSAAPANDRSIAVLAFEDLSQEGDQAYFADGLSEELLNLLAKTPELQVAGRTSSFAFKGQHRDLREIGEILNVAHVLEGSVRKAGNNIRVTAQLVSTADGFHLFSETYDDELSDIFAVQDKIARQISAALKTELIGEQAAAETPVTDVRAYELYLEARQKIHRREGIELEQASALLDAALVIDPEYPPALAQKALVIALLSDSQGSYGDIPESIAYAQAAELIDEALALDPDLADAHAVRGLILPWATRADEAKRHLERALEINPTLENANIWLSNLLATLGQEAEANALLERVVERDPLFAPAFGNLVQEYVRKRELDRATALIDRFERAGGEVAAVANARATAARARGDYAEAIRQFRQAFEADPSSSVMRFNYGITLWTLGIVEPLIELEAAPFEAIYYLENGDHDKAREFVDGIPMPTDQTGIFRLRSFIYLRSGDLDGIVAMVENDFGGLDRFLEQFPRTTDFGLSHMPDLAYTYRELGQPANFDKVMSAMRRALDAQHELSVDPLDLWYGEARYAALDGDLDGVVTAFRRIAEEDDVDVDPLRDAEFAPYRDDAALRAIVDTIRERANAERAELGLPPYRPLLSGNAG